MSAVTRPAQDAPPPGQGALAFDLAVCVGDGVRGLSRVVNVLALLEITPLALSAAARDGELDVTAILSAAGRDARLGVERLRALPCVRSARLSPLDGEIATSLPSVC
jgi:hypothetical protein